MKYSVDKLAKLSGVSVRTLHYYDEIGLLKPSFVKDNGYRFYEEKELNKLQQILFFRELEFSLNDIKSVINSPNYSTEEALKEQKKLLVIKKKRINKLIQTIEKTLKGGENMKTNTNSDDLFASFDDQELVENMREAKKRWGNTDAYRQSVERTKNWSKKDYERIKEEGKKFTQKLADAMDQDIKSKEVQELIAQHYQGVETFYDCSYEMYRKLGEMYVTDPKFTAFYDKFRPGLANWLQKAINYYCDLKEEKS